METTIFNLTNCPACNAKLMLSPYNYLDNIFEKYKYLECNNCNIFFTQRYFSEELGTFNTLKDKLKRSYFTLLLIKISEDVECFFYLDNYKAYEFRLSNDFSFIRDDEFEHYKINNENYLLICNYICKTINNIIFA